MRDFLLSGVVRNAVNVPSISAELLEQLRPYLVLGEKLGRFQGQLSAGKIEEIEIEYAGEIAELRVAAVTIAVLKGLLESVIGPRQHGERAGRRPAARHQGGRVEGQPAARLREHRRRRACAARPTG